MKPELVAFLRHVLDKKFDPSIGGVDSYFKSLSQDEIFEIVSSEIGTEIDKELIYDNLQEMIGRLRFKHGPYWMIHQYIPPKIEEIDVSKIKKTAYFRLIGDVHAKQDRYARLATQSEYSLQVGDMGFDYSYLTRVVKDSDRIRVNAGNHDNYSKSPCENCQGEDCLVCQGKGYIYGQQSKHFLKDYGIWQPPEFMPIFYVRGAWSIDWKYRTPEVSWWADEEIPYKQMLKALELYKATKPEFVVSHTAPFSVVPSIPFERIFGNHIHESRTETLLEEMYDFHQPTWWIFGHFHTDWMMKFQKTTFVCLNELSCMDFPKNFNNEQLEPKIVPQ